MLGDYVRALGFHASITVIGFQAPRSGGCSSKIARRKFGMNLVCQRENLSIHLDETGPFASQILPPCEWKMRVQMAISRWPEHLHTIQLFYVNLDNGRRIALTENGIPLSLQ